MLFESSARLVGHLAFLRGTMISDRLHLSGLSAGKGRGREGCVAEGVVVGVRR